MNTMSQDTSPTASTLRDAAIASTSGIAALVAAKKSQPWGNLAVDREITSPPSSQLSFLQKAKLMNLALKDTNSTTSRVRAFGVIPSIKFRKELNAPGPLFVPKGPGGARKSYVQNTGSKNFHTMLHELGHAKDYSISPKLKLIAKKVADQGYRAKMFAGLGAASLMSEDTAPYAPLVPLIAAAPQLRAETAANVHGFNYLKRINPSTAAKNRFLQVAAKNLFGYATPVLAASGVLALGAQARKHYSQSS